MLTKEEQELVLRVTGLADIAKAKDVIRAEEQAIRDATAALRANAMSEAQWEYATRSATAEIRKQETAIKALDHQTRAYQQNLTALGYGINDFFAVSGGLDQRLNSIANNLPGMLAGFGNIGLILGAITPIVAVAVRNWDAIAKSLGLTSAEADKAKDSLKRLEDRIKELSEQKIKLAVDVHELDVAEAQLKRLKEGKAAFDKTKEGTNSAQEEAGSRVSKALSEGGEGEDIANSLKAKMAGEIEGTDATIQGAGEKVAKLNRQIAGARGMYADSKRKIFLDQIKKINEDVALARERIAKHAEQEVGALIKAAESGKDDEAAGNLAARLDNVGREDVAKKVRKATPGQVGRERDKEFSDWVEQNDRQIEADMATAAKKAKKRDDEFSDWVEQNDRQIEAGFSDQKTKRSLAKPGNKLNAFGADTPGEAAFKSDAARKGEEIAGATDIDERAAAEAALMRAGKGSKRVNHRTGNLIPLDPEQQRIRLQKMIRDEIRRVAPELGPQKRDEVAKGMTKTAFEEAELSTKGVLGGAKSLEEGGAELLRQIQAQGAQAAAMQRAQINQQKATISTIRQQREAAMNNYYSSLGDLY